MARRNELVTFPLARLRRTAAAALAACLVALGAPPCPGGDLDWPAIEAPHTKAWTRWWWHGNAVAPRDLTREMEKYAAAGIGGLEITPIYGIRGGEAEFIDYLSPQWMDMFEHVLREADRLGMEIDMSTGTGWPFGGLWVDADTACRTLVLKTYGGPSGPALPKQIRHVDEPMVRALGRRMRIEDLKEPLRDNPNLQALALDRVKFAKEAPLVALTGYGPNGEKVDLTSKVAADGSLEWREPSPGWTYYAVFLGWHGKMVERAGPGGEGNVIDHFSREALADYLQKFDDAFAGRDIKSFRAFFNDSYEVDDGGGNSNATGDILAEFRRRRGYDLREHMPAFFGQASADETARVLCDYRETISDLLLDEFTQPWTDWAHKHAAITRNQSHGSPANLLDLYAASDIPETEATDRIQFITASSAGHVTGKPLTSAEACTWLDEHFLGTFAAAKSWCDAYFLGGVNHICYHGTAYSPEAEPWPGRLFYASVELQPTSPMWPHFHALNEYVARCQSFLQAGRPDNDVLVYYPIHDEWAAGKGPSMPHFNGEMRGTATRRTAEALLAAGYGLDLISDRQLAAVQAADGKLHVGGASYGALVIPGCRTMPLTTLRRIAALAEGGATIALAGELPKTASGMAGIGPQAAEFTRVAGELAARVGQGRVVAIGAPARGAADLTALAAAGVRPEPFAAGEGLEFIRRRMDDGHAYFIVNRGAEPYDGFAALKAPAASAALFDPLTGDRGRAMLQGAPGTSAVRLQLAPGAACILRTFDRPVEGDAFPYAAPAGQTVALAGPWELTFTQGGPELPHPAQLPQLQSWTSLPGEAVRNFSGIGRYAIKFPKPAQQADAWLLQLGLVHETAEVKLNGKSIATLFAAPYRVRIDANMLQAENSLEIEVANLMANRIADMDRRGELWKRFYNVNMAPRRPENRGPDGTFSAAEWEPLPSGLLGPVTLTPLVVGEP